MCGHPGARVATALAVLVAAGAARAAGPTGIEVGVRTGTELPFGGVTGAPGDGLREATPGVTFIGAEAGYRLTPHFAFGGFFQYGLGRSYTVGDCQAGGCPATNLLVGGQLHWHFLPDRLVDPWAGVGVGYETLEYTSLGGGSRVFDFEGADFFDLQAGADAKPLPSLGVGFFTMLSVGQFSSCSQADALPGWPCTSSTIAGRSTHEWLTLGIRVVYDIRMPSLDVPARPPPPPGPAAPSPPMW